MNKEKPSDGLFTFESKPNEGKFYLDIDKMLDRVYQFKDQQKIDSAIDVIFDVYWQLYNHFDIMNSILAKVDVSKLDADLLVAFLTQTFKYADQVPNHNLFCDRAAVRLRELGYSEDKIHRLVDDFRVVGNYWENMSVLNAPEWLSGPNPNTKK